jgi:hypothetical protein
VGESPLKSWGGGSHKGENEVDNKPIKLLDAFNTLSTNLPPLVENARSLLLAGTNFS